MKNFESFLAYKLDEYITYRQSLGYSGKSDRSKLIIFDRYINDSDTNWKSFQPLFFLEFRNTLKGNPSSINGTISSIRIFFNFLVRQGKLKNNPLQDITDFTERAFIPFVLSPIETDQLLSIIQKKIRKNRIYFLNDYSVYMCILVIARCGLRISESLKLRQQHYNSEEGTLYIENTKFHKDRLIPIPKSTMDELNNYLALRKSIFCGNASDLLFISKSQNKISNNQIYKAFYQAVKDLGLKQEKNLIANTTFGTPVPHCLRHSFAINTLKAAKNKNQTLPVLSAYMGHTKYRYTALYLKLTDAEHRKGLINFAISSQRDL